MLNRKTSNYIFYGTLILILAVALIIRTVALTSLNSNITSVTNSNRNIQAQIDSLKDTVQVNKERQIEYLYELYRQVPAEYNYVKLENYTLSQLELIGITEDLVLGRTITPNEVDTFPTDSIFAPLLDDFQVIEIEVYYNTPELEEDDDLSSEELIEKYIDPFIDSLHNSEQIFIVNNIQYYTSVDSRGIGVSINFLAFYEKVEEES